MKKTIISMFLSGLLTFLLGCRQTTVTKENLLGVWEGKKQNDHPIKALGFNSIKLTFTTDSVEVLADMNAFGGQVITKSTGSWTLNKNIIKTKFGENVKECSVTFKDGKLMFKPDLFFKQESVSSSQYIKTK
jgi:hypothetical protein